MRRFDSGRNILDDGSIVTTALISKYFKMSE